VRLFRVEGSRERKSRDSHCPKHDLLTVVERAEFHLLTSTMRRPAFEWMVLIGLLSAGHWLSVSNCVSGAIEDKQATGSVVVGSATWFGHSGTSESTLSPDCLCNTIR